MVWAAGAVIYRKMAAAAIRARAGKIPAYMALRAVQPRMCPGERESRGSGVIKVSLPAVHAVARFTFRRIS